MIFIAWFTRVKQAQHPRFTRVKSWSKSKRNTPGSHAWNREARATPPDHTREASASATSPVHTREIVKQAQEKGKISVSLFLRLRLLHMHVWTRLYIWMGEHLGIASCWFSKKTWNSCEYRVVVVGLSRASRVFLRVLRFSSLRKINS